MDFISIIIDRVSSTNVFNIIQGRLPTRDTHLQTIVDDDLITEFLLEVSRLSSISNSLSDYGDIRVPIDISGELRRIGETFFQQFFPEQIQERLRASESGFLFLHVDHRLKNIPWELLHDGRCFLADKFYMGKNISGFWKENSRPERDRLRFLIIADPTEDLEWARIEGEGLYESLNAELSADRLDVQFVAGRRITKLSLLNLIKDRDIIHYAGHMFYSRDSQESGWLLSDGKVLRAREIEKAGFSPDLVFSNSCLSSPVSPQGEQDAEEGSRFNDLAGAFLKAGICSYIGTNWEIKDNRKTYDFALNFYRAIFEEKSVGEALFEARQYARRSYPETDLTWANYVLHGNPLARIYRSSNRRTFDASRNILNARRVEESYPAPIASAYAKFLELLEEGMSVQKSLLVLMDTFEKTLLVVGSIIFGNCAYLGMKSSGPVRKSTREWTDEIYRAMSDLKTLQFELAASGLVESMQLHRDSIYKLVGWLESYRSGEINTENQDSYLVTFQYLFDNLLTDLTSLRRYRILYIPFEGDDAVVLHGQKPERMRLLPAEFREPALMEMLERNRGGLCFFNSSKKVIFPLYPFMSYNPVNGEIGFLQNIRAAESV